MLVVSAGFERRTESPSAVIPWAGVEARETDRARVDCRREASRMPDMSGEPSCLLAMSWLTHFGDHTKSVRLEDGQPRPRFGQSQRSPYGAVRDGRLRACRSAASRAPRPRSTPRPDERW